MSYHQLTTEQRNELAALLRGGKHSYREMARVIGVHHSTVVRELRRHAAANKCGYDARKARLALKAKRLAANGLRRKLPALTRLLRFILKKLKQYWSPEQIAGYLKMAGRKLRASHQTIYDWLYTHRADLKPYLHCSKGKYRRTRAATLRRKQRQEVFAKRRIDLRPAEVETRLTYGHWEGDTVVGKGQSGYIATFVERKSGYLLAVKLEDKQAETFRAALARSFSCIVPDGRQTLTLDNGTEMQAYEGMEKDHPGLHVYFAYPYHSWERGTNENTNGLLRKFFPKGMDFRAVTQADVDTAVRLLNTRPRKRLGYRTPARVLLEGGAVRVRG